MVQYRHTLNSTNNWTTFADFLSADSGTNVTSYTDSNPIEYGSSSAGASGGGSGGMTPPGSGSGTNYGSSTNITVGTGFYRVVRDGAHLFGLTNGSVLSGSVKLPLELANDGGTVSTISITENQTPIGNSLQVAPAINPLLAVLDTTLLANGVHVGWPKDKYIGILDGAYINYDHVNFISHIQFEMIFYGRTIKMRLFMRATTPTRIAVLV